MNQEQLLNFEVSDKFFISFFVIDMLITILLDEHNELEDGHWTLKKSIKKQL